jgi:hypothetical protein
MLRSSTVAAVVVLLIGTSARAQQHDHADHFMQCAKACADCQLQCDSCFAHCLGLTAGGKKDHAATTQFCVDCAECCKLAASLSARQSPLAGLACDCCAKCCDKCAEACEKFPGDKHMSDCAKSCRDCAKACREMIKHVGKS